MKILIDTNILLDFIIGREPFYENADKILNLCVNKKAEGYLAAHSVTNLYYIIRKYFQNNECREIIKNLLDFLDVIEIDKNKILESLNDNTFKDFEDRLEVECAKSLNIDYLITRDLKDYTNSKIECVAPEDFLNRLT